MTVFDYLGLLGGVAMLLFGMSLMGDGLNVVSGGKMEGLLKRLVSSKIKGVLLGAGVTAVIQASAATTVMVVALVNSGVLQLQQAVSIIMGANIGTTITAWILSLSGLSGENFWIQMLKPSSFSPILALVGVIILFRAKNENQKAKSSVLLGFSVLMFGMETMMRSMEPLQTSAAFFKIVNLFSNPVLGLLLGMGITALIQSSSAFTGILQALSSTGAITFGAAIPVIMGQNIGTCVTALLSGIGAEVNAKRAAIIHLIFNVLGTGLFLCVFYLGNLLFHYTFLNDTVNAVNIAIIHTTFNVATTLALYPFSDKLVELSAKIIKDKKPTVVEDAVEQDLKLLEPRLLNRPDFAVQQAYAVLCQMMKLTAQEFKETALLFETYTPERHEKIEWMERQVDRYEDALQDYSVKISKASLSDSDANKLTVLMYSLNDIERVSDYGINLADQVLKSVESPQKFSLLAKRELKVYTDAVNEIVHNSCIALESLSYEKAIQIEPLEECIDEINQTLSHRHIERLQNGECSAINGPIIIEMFNSLERIADHCSNIGISVIQYTTKKYLAHEYQSHIDKSSEKFRQKFDYYVAKYPLPAAAEK